MLTPVFLLLLLLSPMQAQRELAGGIEIRQALDRLDTLGSVMMIGAHPDDENTALLAYFSRGRHMRTAYLSLTRGEGGQNLLGGEQGDALGMLRTQELLDARRIDGGEQFFTRAIDFGFTKTAAETFGKWPREKILGDIVWDIRRFRPDVIVLRFSGTPRDGHGQHQVSAILGKEAFSAAADPTRYPEQLQWVQPWQARRLMYNVIAFTAEQEREAAKLADKIEVDVGEYNPELGYSYAEIAGMSRSMHRSQGMGAAERKGSTKNYLLTIGGDPAKKDVFEGIDVSWSRLPGGAAVGAQIGKASSTFDPAHPELLLPLVAEARTLIAAIASGSKDPLAERKLVELDETMALSAALWLDAAAEKYDVTPGGSVKINFTALVRLPAKVTLTGIRLTGMQGAPTLDLAAAVLVDNQPSQYSVTDHVPDDQPYSQPYWLVLPKDGDLYSVPDPRDIGMPENPPILEAHFRLKMAGAEIEITRPVEYRYIDHLYGEEFRPLVVAPPVAVNFAERSIVFADAKPRRIGVPLKATTGRVSGDLQLEAPPGWNVEPASRHFELVAGQQITEAFDLTPPKLPGPESVIRGTVRAIASAGNRKIAMGMQVIDYPHIPAQTLFPSAEAPLVRAEILTLGKNVGYVMGAGDDEPDALRQIGCTVTLLSADDLTSGDLSGYDAVVTGIRSWNTREDVRANYQRLFDYVQNGGTLIVQYNTPEGNLAAPDAPQFEHFGPLPIKIGRDRVVEEDTAVTFPNPDNPLLHRPNPIAPRDFEGWVQERGLNFATEWDPKYQSVLESHDTGEKPLPGGELYLRYGKGVYIFSAYAWFRQLPAGVPGAYRLFANMLSASKTE
jgi:LmbE family N-acetylglucosaminyl deacetylase